MKIIISILPITLLLTFYSCNRKTQVNVAPNFKDFVFAYGDIRSNNSIKFVGNDTLFLQRNFPEDSIGIFFTLLKQNDVDELIMSVNKFNNSKYEKQYTNRQVEDGRTYVFMTERNQVYMHQNGPLELELLANRLQELKKRQKFIKTKSHIDFGSLENVVPPPPPPPNFNSR